MESVTGSKFNETAAASDFQQLANAAPSAIRSDLQTVATAFSTFASALKKSGYVFGKTPTATQTAALESATSVFEQPKLKAADAALQAWSVKNCR
jgi:glutathione S-transferase